MATLFLLRRAFSCNIRPGVVRPLSSVSCRWWSSSSSSSNDDSDSDHSVSIGDVRVDSAPPGSGRPDLVPSLNSLSESQYIPRCQLSHLRWMLQKDLALQQDFCLLGPPALARDRRHLLLLYAALIEREIEYVALSRDTSDADLKQRKEVSQHASVYVDQAPVRAALNGRLLILDGLDKAERNVLPTLNNLLENRELSLDDGGLLVSPQVYDAHSTDGDEKNYATVHQIHRVHPSFRVAALASLHAGNTAPLDPPLRSRFQARLAMTVDPGEMLHALSAVPSRTLSNDTIRELVQMAASVPENDGTSLQSIHDAARYLEHYPNRLSTRAALQAQTGTMIQVSDIEGQLKNKLIDSPQSVPANFVETSTTQTLQDMILGAFDANLRAVAIVGPKGCYKSALTRALAHKCGRSTELFSLYSDMTARDLLLTRGTDLEGNTVWRTTPLTRALEHDAWVILDGVDKLSADTLSSLAMILEQGITDLPDERRLQAGENFRCIALAHPPEEQDWITPEVAGMFHWIRVHPLPSHELTTVLERLYPSLDRAVLEQIVNLRDRLDQAISSGAADTAEEQDSLLLSLRKIKHICRRVEQQLGSHRELAHLVHNALMTHLMPERERRIVEKCLMDCGIVRSKPLKQQRKQAATMELDQELLASNRRTPQHPLLVPNPVFEENPGHTRVLQDILDAHSVGERALLIMGFQGVGKNRVVDSLLWRLHAEREYLQLNRDFTVQSLLSSPSIEGGRIIYGDSPLVRAAKHGRILVLDEADKAPVEVVALLKGLIEDGELALPDGRVLRYDCDLEDENDNTIPIHPDFRVWALANPAGYPFHGNDLAREMADVFSCHTVPPLDTESQARILKRYGPDVSEYVVDNILDIWKDLRDAHERGLMAYPFSVREAVSVVKHLHRFPADGLEGALENVISFDRFDNALLKQLDAIFTRHGLPALATRSVRTSTGSTEGGVSTPRTRTSSPRHGKVDPNNEPHVGGNTWAGGTGGSDTAGLGGRGGPYRLDSGHPVHQVSDEMKAEVSEEAQQKAREMAAEALEQKLKDLDMGQLDWERYNYLHDQVDTQIQQLHVLLKDIKRRKQERIWLKRQSTGELDDSRLVDALAGEKDVFKRRGQATESHLASARESQPMCIKLVVDVSASMYRFNGYDGRLERLLEATLMIMEALKEDERFQLKIVGHNGTSADIPFVIDNTPQDPKMQLRILESMIAHTQYTYAGDRTLEAIESAVNSANEGDLILIISDANLRRYRITPEDVSSLLRRKDVHAHLVFIGSMGEEANKLARAIPNERAQVCLDSEELPLIIKSIVAAAAK